MIFSGYIPLNRGLIEHTKDGRLTNNEALVFVWLLMLADHKTGGYTINQPTLRSFLPGLGKDAAQRALETLEDKRYIYRDVKPRNRSAYRYWIDNFTPTDGPHKSSRLDLSQVFATKDTSKLRYVPVAPETSPATQPASPNSNKKEEVELKKDTPVGSLRGERMDAWNGERVNTSRSEPNGESEVSGRCADGDTKGCTDGERMEALPLGIVFRDGAYYTETGTKLHPNSVDAILGKEQTK